MYGMTPLMKAAGLGRKYYVEELLRLGANRDLKDKEGKTALDYANLFEQYEVLDIL